MLDLQVVMHTTARFLHYFLCNDGLITSKCIGTTGTVILDFDEDWGVRLFKSGLSVSSSECPMYVRFCNMLIYDFPHRKCAITV